MAIAIDGPAASGKSTVGRALAERLGCTFLDTGLMYRVVTKVVIDRHVDTRDIDGMVAVAEGVRFALDAEHDDNLLADGRRVGDEVRSADVDRLVSAVAAYPEVRAVMVRRQRELALDGCIVMVGRDIGTVVLPEAEVKLWITASPAERARRRLKEALGPAQDMDAVQRAIEERDRKDESRPTSPLRKADDAVEVWTDGMSPEDVVSQVVQLVQSRKPVSTR